MPTEVYVKTTDDEGKEVFAPVTDWSAVEVPEDVVRKHPITVATTQESIKRRQTIADLKTRLSELEGGDEKPAAATPTPTEQPSGLGYKTRDELYADIENFIASRNDTKAKAQREEDERLNALINEHKLSTEVLPQLRNSKDPAELARYLGQQKLKFDDYSGGEQRQKPTVDSIAEKVRQTLNLNNKEN